MPRLDRNIEVADVQRLARRWQAVSRRVPEQQLQQQRNVAQRLDIEGGELRQQPVAGQPADADQRAEDGRQHDADHGDLERVQDADDQRAAEGIDRPDCRGSAIRRSECRRHGRGRRSRWRYGARRGCDWCCRPDTRRSATTMPTMTTCQTIARNRGSDQENRRCFFGAAARPISRGSATVPDMAVSRPLSSARTSSQASEPVSRPVVPDATVRQSARTDQPVRRDAWCGRT